MCTVYHTLTCVSGTCIVHVCVYMCLGSGSVVIDLHEPLVTSPYRTQTLTLLLLHSTVATRALARALTAARQRTNKETSVRSTLSRNAA